MKDLLKTLKSTMNNTPPEYCEGTDKYAVLIDPGHGGVIDGKYVTAPNKMAIHDGWEFWEGLYNRALAWYFAYLLFLDRRKYAILVPGNLDISLRVRVNRANMLAKNPILNGAKVYLHSIHGNYFGLRSVNGVEVYTSPGYTPSDPIATIYFEELTKLGWNMRAGFNEDLQNDPDKEAKFTILTDTNMPAILTETGFYSNPEQARNMCDPYIIYRIATLFRNAHAKVCTLNLVP